MITKETLIRLTAGVLLLSIVLACTVSLDLDGKEAEKSPAERTLEALYLEQTAAALPVVDAGGNTQPAVTVTHTLIPGNPGSPDVEKDEIDTSNTAGTRTALGDSFRLGNFERPFSEGDMVYHPELDIVKLELSAGDDFYYFTFLMSGSGTDGFGAAYYGIEFDTDYDGRGDYLLWARGTDSTDWVIDGVMLLEDANGNVGGSSPVVPDKNPGDGYERVLFGPNDLTDPDVAWVRVSGSDIQLVVKRSYIDKNRWYWRAWADGGMMDPAKFDYNDQFSEEQAGSPNKNSSQYPIAALHMMDSTCWIAYNLEPTGTELGGCVQIQPTLAPDPTDVPPCDCSRSCTSFGFDITCCNYCNCSWQGVEFGCYPP
jgi:hypothetical protein